MGSVGVREISLSMTDMAPRMTAWLVLGKISQILYTNLRNKNELWNEDDACIWIKISSTGIKVIRTLLIL
jgi:hypothetical protein